MVIYYVPCNIGTLNDATYIDWPPVYEAALGRCLHCMRSLQGVRTALGQGRLTIGACTMHCTVPSTTHTEDRYVYGGPPPDSCMLCNVCVNSLQLVIIETHTPALVLCSIATSGPIGAVLYKAPRWWCAKVSPLIAYWWDNSEATAAICHQMAWDCVTPFVLTEVCIQLHTSHTNWTWTHVYTDPYSPQEWLTSQCGHLSCSWSCHVSIPYINIPWVK